MDIEIETILSNIDSVMLLTLVPEYFYRNGRQIKANTVGSQGTLYLTCYRLSLDCRSIQFHPVYKLSKLIHFAAVSFIESDMFLLHRVRY